MNFGQQLSRGKGNLSERRATEAFTTWSTNLPGKGIQNLGKSVIVVVYLRLTNTRDYNAISVKTRFVPMNI